MAASKSNAGGFSVPSKVHPGDEITAELFNALVDAIAERTPGSGKNTRVQPQGAAGYVIEATVPRPSAASVAPSHPFQLLVSPNDETTVKVRVVVGRVSPSESNGSIVPTISGVRIDGDGVPEDVPSFTIGNSISLAFWLRLVHVPTAEWSFEGYDDAPIFVLASGGYIAEASIVSHSSDTTPPTGGRDPSVNADTGSVSETGIVHWLIGTIHAGVVATPQHVNSNLFMAFCPPGAFHDGEPLGYLFHPTSA